jgi:phosphatidylinositol 4-kinase B
VKPRIGPAIIGMSSVLAGVPGLPQLTLTTGRVAIEQGRIPDDKGTPKPFQSGEDDEFAGGLSPTSSILLQKPEELDVDSDELEGDIEEESDEEQDVDTFGQSTMSKLAVPTERKSMDRTSMSPAAEVTKQSTLVRRTTIGPSRTSPSLARRSRILNQRASSPSASTPSLHILGASPTQEDITQRIDPLIAEQLLRGHYCRSEVQFVLSLESIANRLLVVPKLAVSMVYNPTSHSAHTFIPNRSA